MSTTIRWRPPAGAARLLAFTLGVTSAGCASTSPVGNFRDVSAAVKERSGHGLYWDPAGSNEAKVDPVVGDLLHGDFGVEQAVQIALLENRTLTALYEDLSISQADLVQAGLLRNPSFGVGMTTAEGDRLSPNLELGLSWDFLDLLLLPAKKKIAATEVEATKWRVADALLDVICEVKRAYFELAAAEQVRAMRQLVAESAQVLTDLSAKQNEAGTASDLSLANQESSSEQLAIELARARTDAAVARERLVRLLGLSGPRASIRPPARLPDVPSSEAPLRDLESLAIKGRFDLASMRKEREALDRTLSLVKASRFTPGIGVGVTAGRLTDGNIAVAPNASFDLPIFDQGQAVVARLEAMVRAADARLEARSVEIRSDVRAAHERMEFARGAVVRYRTKVIPLRERVVALSQQQYDSMLLGVYQLLAAKQGEISAYREAIEAARDYWIARVDLERAIGVRLPTGAADTTPTPRSQP